MDVAQAQSDPSPMVISCVVYHDGKRVEEIDIARIAEYLGRSAFFVWVALHEPSSECLDTMGKLFHLHPLALEDAQKGHQRPKIEEYGDSLFAVLHLVEPVDHELCLGEFAVFVGIHYVLTVRSRATRGFHEVRVRCEREPELLRRGPGYVLYALIDAVVDRYFPVLEQLEDEMEEIERLMFAPQGAPRENIEAQYGLKRRLMVIKHAVAPLLEGVSNLSGARVPVLCSGMGVYFRDVYDHLLRLNQTADSIRDTIATAISVNLSMVTLQESETMKRLAAYAALLAVPTMIAGIYGMNFENMPELKWRYGYASVMLLMVLLDVYLYARFRKSNWL